MTKIYGLSAVAKSRLKKLAHETIGKASISSFAKYLLLQQLEKSPIKNKRASDTEPNSRIEVRLSEPTKARLTEYAIQSEMTPNQYASMLLQQHVQNYPVLSTSEIKAVYQSNQQLLAIGRNLNQIARALNANQSTSLSLKLLEELEETITQHTQKVGHIISNNWDRMP
ncbi:Bacterial mobilisation protein (MobC) [Oligella urethralis]|uniref:plasmid mobilization relaxosome protein MobC n=1 Tax=Oligella urethralis TaxID=90245 RepID=UPI000DFE21C5|nr:plasmid mobilization relaxosome protein MobC [Oligella urethralis]SUA61307.1 Bacterial mobilisation protein (MobC) [Oligella urethralis]